MKTKCFLPIVLMISIMGCTKEDLVWNLKHDNDMDVNSYNFSDNAFQFEKTFITNPNNNIPDPSGWSSTVGSIDLNLAVNKINSGLTYYIGICWGIEIDPDIYGNTAFGEGDKYGNASWSDMDASDIRFELNDTFIGGGKKFSMRESAYGASGSYNSYLQTNTTYHFRYFLYIETDPSKGTNVGYYSGPVVTKYSEDFNIYIP